jgi:predicted membrane channel-forming protein YqfA (hemolysin III family)
MNERAESRIIFLLSIALALFGIFAPFKWHDMPSWLTNSALSVALCLFLWAIFLSIPSRSKGATKLISALLIAGGISSTIIGLVFYLSEPDSSSIDKVSANGGPSTSPSEHRPLGGLTNAQLRERARSLAKSLRAFQDAADHTLSQILLERYTKSAAGEDQTTVWHESVTKQQQFFNDLTSEFAEKYLNEAVTVRNELKIRLGTLPMPSDDVVGRAKAGVGLPVFDGLLTGPHPASEAAALLEYWASQLP